MEYFWNSWASAQKDIVLIVCGSATSWITNKIINNHGGLHNRITGQIYIQPFSLAECEAYFTAQNIEMSRYEMVENYMIFGGIPYYLSFMKKELSMVQNIDNLLFNDRSRLTIKRALGISGVSTKTASWRSADSENAAQIDLLIERKDNVINLCEMKYAGDEFIIDKDYDKVLRNKRSTFKTETKTRKAVHITMVTIYGVKRNKYSGNIQSEITVNELF